MPKNIKPQEIEDDLDFLTNDIEDVNKEEISKEEKKALEKAKKEEAKKTKAKSKKEVVKSDDLIEAEEVDIEETTKTPHISKKELVKQLKEDPKLLKELQKQFKEEEPKGKKEDAKSDDSIGRLADILQSFISTKGSEGIQTSNSKFQGVLAMANKQAILNLESFRKKFAEERKQGDVGFVMIGRGFEQHLPTRSIMVPGPNGEKIKQTQFEIGLNGVIFTFKLGTKYSNVPITIAEYVNRKIAKYISVVSSETEQKYSNQAFDITKNSI